MSYIDAGNEVARVHQYLRTDGTIGASGLPDPKRIWENGVAYRLRSPAENSWQQLRYRLSDLWDRIRWSIGMEVD